MRVALLARRVSCSPARAEHGSVMRTMELRTADGRQVARGVRLACSFTSRWSGRFRRVPSSAQDQVLLIPCRSVHTIGMRCAIDVVCLSRQMRIVGLVPAFPAWRFRLAPAGTRWILQLAAGQIAATGLTLGTFVVVESSVSGGAQAGHADSGEHAGRGPRGDCESTPRSTDGSARPPCERSPLRFSLRLPHQRRCNAHVHHAKDGGRNHYSRSKDVNDGCPRSK